MGTKHPLDVGTLTEDQRGVLAHLWKESALAEHASIAAFATFVSELLTLGAPPELIESAQRAMGDEIRHAKDCFSLLAVFSGASHGPGAYPQAATRSDFSLEHMLRNVVLDGCLNETIAAAIVDAESRCALHPHTRDVLATIAADEQKHAALAWKTLHWVLARHPEWVPQVRAWFQEGITAYWGQEHVSHPWTHPWGRLSGEAKRTVVRAALRKVVEPCVDQVLHAVRHHPVENATTPASPEMHTT